VNGTVYESRTGKWINEDDGSFQGSATFTKTPTYQRVNKNGTVLKSDFEVTNLYDEYKDASGAVNVYQRIYGKEKLADGYFQGEKIIEKTPTYQRINKNGTITVPEFQGTLIYDEYKASTGVTNTFEKKSGIWRVSAATKLQGSITMEVSPSGVKIVDGRK